MGWAVSFPAARLSGHGDEGLARHRPAADPGERPHLNPRVAVVEGVVVVVDEVAEPAAGEHEVPARADHAGVGALHLHPAAVHHVGAPRIQVRPGDRRGPSDWFGPGREATDFAAASRLGVSVYLRGGRHGAEPDIGALVVLFERPSGDCDRTDDDTAAPDQPSGPARHDGCSR
jgi:hypothetical protein